MFHFYTLSEMKMTRHTYNILTYSTLSLNTDTNRSVYFAVNGPFSNLEVLFIVRERGEWP